jgi:mannose-6-phosphate isomerase-like protein (cupin superfamily)
MINIITWNDAINSCDYDESVGIKIAKLATSDTLSTFITEINPHKSVNAHYHKYGNEHYHIISGNGEIQLENVLNGEKCSHKVSAGQSFVVPENVLHKLINTNPTTPLVLMFSCPPSHLDTDRYFQ